MTMDFGKIPPVKRRIILPDKKNGHWNFPEQMGIDKVGFICAIRDLVLQRGYIGKKLYRKQGQINKGEEYPWRYYKSSSKTMAPLFAQRPIEEFQFICLEEYATKGGLGWAETWTMCMLEVPTTPLWYNTRIEKVTWSVREGVTFRHKERMERLMKWDDTF